MSPPVEKFPATELPARVQIYQKGYKDKRRKTPVDLEKCELMEMLQYRCDPRPGRMIVCEEVVKLFRRCAGGVMVETTAWEGHKMVRKPSQPELLRQ